MSWTETIRSVIRPARPAVEYFDGNGSRISGAELTELFNSKSTLTAEAGEDLLPFARKVEAASNAEEGIVK